MTLAELMAAADQMDDEQAKQLIADAIMADPTGFLGEIWDLENEEDDGEDDPPPSAMAMAA